MAGIDHYENFPVASWLCPAPLRPGVQAIYHFARTADDLADEGVASPTQRLADLGAYRQALMRVLDGNLPTPDSPWAAVFVPLAQSQARHHWPPELLLALLDAFEEDVQRTAMGQRYQNMTELLAYCQRSANPVGRLLLHMLGVGDSTLLQQSDAICTALQLINFWQDLSQDLARGRHYLPTQMLAAHGLQCDDVQHLEQHKTQAQALMQSLLSHARQTMLTGAPLALAMRGRFGWELRGVVQGGLRVLERMQAHGGACWTHRPKLGRWDGLLVAWRVVRM